MSITEVEARLVMDFKHSPGMVGDLEHWQYDTFRVTWRDPLVEPAYVTFALGRVARCSASACAQSHR